MEKQLTVSVPYYPGEDGLTLACKEGKLFRNDEKLEDLYKQGFRIYDYAIVNDNKSNSDKPQTFVKVILKK